MTEFEKGWFKARDAQPAAHKHFFNRYCYRNLNNYVSKFFFFNYLIVSKSTHFMLHDFVLLTNYRWNFFTINKYLELNKDFLFGGRASMIIFWKEVQQKKKKEDEVKLLPANFIRWAPLIWSFTECWGYTKPFWQRSVENYADISTRRYIIWQ